MGFTKSAAPKDQTLELRLTAAEKAAVAARAADCNLSVSAYVLRCALAKQTRTRHDVTVILELRGIAAALKALHAAAPQAPPADLQRALDAVVVALDRVWAGHRA